MKDSGAVTRTLAKLFFATFMAHSYGTEMSRPMNEMHGDCSNYEMNVNKEMALWDENATAIPAESQASLPLSKRVSLSLTKQGLIHLVHDPAKSFPVNGQAYAGVFRVRASKTGTLKIAAGQKLWFDLVDESSKKIVAATNFEMQTNCKKIFKAVEFSVSNNRTYFLQVTSSNSPSADFLLAF